MLSKSALQILNVVLRPIDRSISILLSPRWRSQKIERPIFIIGVERSGTTLVYSLLANHPDFYWLSRLDSIIPDCPLLSCFIRRGISFFMPDQNYVAIPRAISRSRGMIPPSECLPYWRRIFNWGSEDNYIVDDDYFTEMDATDSLRKFIYRDLRVRLAFSKKSRLLFKQPGLSLKIRFLNSVFEDAIFLHVIRDPITNFLSLVQAKNRSQEKFWGVKVPGWREFLQSSNEVQSVLQIRRTLEIIDQDIQQIKGTNRYFRIYYE
ncbi:sulfotransferase, partial [Ardenticatena maritima]